MANIDLDVSGTSTSVDVTIKSGPSGAEASDVCNYEIFAVVSSCLYFLSRHQSAETQCWKHRTMMTVICL